MSHSCADVVTASGIGLLTRGHIDAGCVLFSQKPVASLLIRIETVMNAELIRWDFARNRQHLMCTVQRRPADSFYDVAIVPLWNIGSAAIETFTTATGALRRHATIASELRDAGWRIAAYSA